MTTWATPYQSAVEPCEDHAQAGTIALNLVINRMFPGTGSLGIYNCRHVGGTDTMSIHSDGRAWDCAIPLLPGGRPDLALGDPVLALLSKHAVELGIQCVIWNDTLYSARHPEGTEYFGESPHYDHLHIEQVWYQAQHLSVAEIVEILDGEPGGDDQDHQPLPPSEEDDMHYLIIADAGRGGPAYAWTPTTIRPLNGPYFDSLVKAGAAKRQILFLPSLDFDHLKDMTGFALRQAATVIDQALQDDFDELERTAPKAEDLLAEVGAERVSG